ncbi:Kelch repeat-containing protein [Ekhidna sp.]
MKITQLLLLVVNLLLFAACSNDDESVTESEILQVTDTSLEFSEIFTYGPVSISSTIKSQIDMVSLSDNNSIYFAYRNDLREEALVKFDPTSKELIENTFDNSDFTSKQLVVVDNELFVFGGRYLNIYDLDLMGTPRSMAHGIATIWFGSAYDGEDIYIIGGETSLAGEDVDASQIFKWDFENETLVPFSNLPEPRFGARSVISDGFIYVFGGFDISDFENKNTVYKISIDNPEDIEEFNNIPASQFTFVRRVKNLIYLGGTSGIDDSDELVSTIGIFNTIDNSYTALSSNLILQGVENFITQMTILNDKMYVIGKRTFSDSGVEYTIYEAPLKHK